MYQEVTFKLERRPRCRLTVASLLFRQFDEKGKLMPMQLAKVRKVQGIFQDNGIPAITLKPGHETAITVRTADGTGYDESVSCANA
jgi:hypothetical protein